MLGAIIGDITGSRYEFHNIKTTDFPLISRHSEFTDDTVMTCAVADALMRSGAKNSTEDFEKEVITSMQTFGHRYPNAGYGGRFYTWLFEGPVKPYKSFGNGSAMRVSPVAWAFNDLESVEKFAASSARVTHNHHEGIKGAQAVAGSIFLARTGKSKAEIKNYVQEKYHYDLSRTLDEIRPTYRFNETCQDSVPQAITAFLEANDFEDSIRKAVSIGGDSDTIAAITGSIAEGAFGISDEMKNMYIPLLDDFLRDILKKWDLWLKERT